MKNLFVLFISLFIFIMNGSICLAETVAFNTQSYKYHKPSCKWAHKCTVNCIYIDKKEAIKRGGVPCKVCKPKTY